MNRKLSLFFVALFILSGCSTPSKPQHNILGTTWGWPADIVTVKSDMKISELRVRVVRRLSEDCITGYIDHIEIDGPIGPDSSEVLDRVLQKIESCFSIAQQNRISTSVYLNSGGGYLKDGYKMGELFRKYYVTTTITGGQTCASACSVAFLGGKYRVMEHNAVLLFHSPYRNYGIGIDCSDNGQVGQMKDYFVNQLGTANGSYLHQRTMSYCSRSDGWTLNADAAKLFGITTK